MKFVTISKEEFDTFAKDHPNRCYLQTSAIATLREKNGWESHFLGVKEKNKLIAATILLSKKRRIKKEFYSLRGPLLDFKDEKGTLFFLENLKKYCKEHDGFLLRIDPYYEEMSLDRDGKETKEFDHRKDKEYFKKIGFKEIIAEKPSDTVQAKYMYVIDLKENLEDVMKEMDSKTRQMIRKNEKAGIIIRKGTKEDLPLFEDIMEKTSKRRNFENRGNLFYKNLYEALEKENRISLVFAELDTSIALLNIEKEKEEIAKARKDREEKRKLGKCNEKKAQIKEIEERKTLEKLKLQEEKIKQLKKEKKEKITLGGILYVLYEKEMASVFGGSYEEYKEYQPFYTIHYEMIKEAISNHYQRYNFYAISNHLDPSDPQYGIYLFKRGFGGHVISMIGEFVLPIDFVQYKLYQWKRKFKTK